KYLSGRLSLYARTAFAFYKHCITKSHIALYHMGIYMMPQVHDWFVNEYPKQSKRKLDMGKSCIRFKKPDDIPFDLITELIQKISAEEYINTYESLLKK